MCAICVYPTPAAAPASAAVAPPTAAAAEVNLLSRAEIKCLPRQRQKQWQR